MPTELSALQETLLRTFHKTAPVSLTEFRTVHVDPFLDHHFLVETDVDRALPGLDFYIDLAAMSADPDKRCGYRSPLAERTALAVVSKAYSFIELTIVAQLSAGVGTHERLNERLSARGVSRRAVNNALVLLVDRGIIGYAQNKSLTLRSSTARRVLGDIVFPPVIPAARERFEAPTATHASASLRDVVQQLPAAPLALTTAAESFGAGAVARANTISERLTLLAVEDVYRRVVRAALESTRQLRPSELARYAGINSDTDHVDFRQSEAYTAGICCRRLVDFEAMNSLAQVNGTYRYGIADDARAVVTSLYNLGFDFRAACRLETYRLADFSDVPNDQLPVVTHTVIPVRENVYTAEPRSPYAVAADATTEELWRYVFEDEEPRTQRRQQRRRRSRRDDAPRSATVKRQEAQPEPGIQVDYAMLRLQRGMDL